MSTFAEYLGVDGTTRPLKIGKSFSWNETPYHSIRCDFKPVAAELDETATLDVGENDDVSLTVPLEGGGATNFQGSQKCHLKECVLIFDHTTGEITLERLGSNIQLKRTRNPGSSKPTRPPFPFDKKKLSPMSGGGTPTRSGMSPPASSSSPSSGFASSASSASSSSSSSGSKKSANSKNKRGGSVGNGDGGCVRDPMSTIDSDSDIGMAEDDDDGFGLIMPSNDGIKKPSPVRVQETRHQMQQRAPPPPTPPALPSPHNPPAPTANKKKGGSIVSASSDSESSSSSSSSSSSEESSSDSSSESEQEDDKEEEEEEERKPKQQQPPLVARGGGGGGGRKERVDERRPKAVSRPPLPPQVSQMQDMPLFDDDLILPSAPIPPPSSRNANTNNHSSSKRNILTQDLQLSDSDSDSD